MTGRNIFRICYIYSRCLISFIGWCSLTFWATMYMQRTKTGASIFIHLVGYTTVIKIEFQKWVAVCAKTSRLKSIRNQEKLIRKTMQSDINGQLLEQVRNSNVASLSGPSVSLQCYSLLLLYFGQINDDKWWQLSVKQIHNFTSEHSSSVVEMIKKTSL